MTSTMTSDDYDYEHEHDAGASISLALPAVKGYVLGCCGPVSISPVCGLRTSKPMPASCLMSRFFHKQPAEGGSPLAMTRENALSLRAQEFEGTLRDIDIGLRFSLSGETPNIECSTPNAQLLVAWRPFGIEH